MLKSSSEIPVNFIMFSFDIPLENFTFFPINEKGETNKEKLSYLISNSELNNEELSRLVEEGKAVNGKNSAELRAKALKLYDEVINKYGSLLKNNENIPVDQEQLPH